MQLKTLYIQAATHVPFLRKIRKALWSYKGRRYSALEKDERIDERCVFFESFGGRSYSCSPKSLFEEMCADSRFDGWTFIWSFTAEQVAEGNELPPLVMQRAKTVVHETDDYLRALAKAKYWIQNNRIPEYINPGKDHVYIQCWHGTPLKKLGFDIPEDTCGGALNTPAELAARYKKDADKWTYLISPSRFTTEHLCSAFGVDAKSIDDLVIEEGYPRNDEIARTLESPDAKSHISALKNHLLIPQKKKVLLYAPTYREDSFDASKGYTFKLSLDLDQMRSRLGEDWVVLLRLHYYVSNNLDISPWKGFAYDVSNVEDVNELYCVSDALCTDYSSVLFDYANTQRPLFFFWPDFQHYASELHGLYLAPDELPGPKCKTTEELADEVDQLELWDERYGADYTAFLERFCPHDDGYAAKRVIGKVFSQVGVR